MSQTKLLFVFVAIFVIISSCYCYVMIMSVRGQGFPPSLPVEVWIDASPNPAYLGDTVYARFSIYSEDEEWIGKQIEYNLFLGSSTGSYILGKKEEGIPAGGTAIIPSSKFQEMMGGKSQEYAIDIGIGIQHWQEHFQFYNYSRPPDKPFLMLERFSALTISPKKTEYEMTQEITIEIKNIGSGDAKNVKVTDSFPPKFELISGSANQEYNVIKQNEQRTYQYYTLGWTSMLEEKELYILDPAIATYENDKGESFSSHSTPFVIKVPAVVIGPPPTASATPSPTSSPTPTPIEQTPTPLPTPSPTPTPLSPMPQPDDGNNSWIYLIIAVLAGIVVLLSFKPIMIAYYTRKMNKWEREGYDVSKLKEVLKK